MKLLGVSAFYHDSAACLVLDGDIAAAAQEERFTRKKHDNRFPRHAIAYCVAEAGVRPQDLDYIVFYEKPFLKFERLLETYLAFAPRGLSSFVRFGPVWLRHKLFQRQAIACSLRALWGSDCDWGERLLFSEHHLSHAASAFFPSPFEDAAILTLDGVGEWTTSSVATGHANQLTVQREIHFPHSLGLLYSAFTYYTGFKVNSGEYKVMGLAPYGVPRYAPLIRDNLIEIRDDGSFALNLHYFNYCTGLTMTNRAFHDLFGGPPRPVDAPLTQRDMDLAASIQLVTEEVILKMARGLKAATGERNLCLAGGVALNCVANGKLHRERIFDNIWIQPASGDAGGALGAALSVYHMMHNGVRHIQQLDSMKGSYLGPAYTQSDIESRLRAAGATFKTLSDTELVDFCARVLADGKTLGWHQGRMEFGPRALGARSILGDPRSPSMQRTLNLQVKRRESFRPFAPSVLCEDVADWFDLDVDSPYMLLVAAVTSSKRHAAPESAEEAFGIDLLNACRSNIPAVTHVDYSARVQTVHVSTNPRFHALISRFKAITGCPILVNTSFNVRGEPVVNTPEEAFWCFMGTDIDFLCCGNAVMEKTAQDPSLRPQHAASFELD